MQRTCICAVIQYMSTLPDQELITSPNHKKNSEVTKIKSYIIVKFHKKRNEGNETVTKVHIQVTHLLAM